MMRDTQITTDPVFHTQEMPIRQFQALARRKALRLEAVGLKRRGRSVLSIIKQETGLQARTAKAMIPLYDKWLEDNDIIQF